MPLKLRDVARFGRSFLPVFIGCVLLYPIVLPPYQDAVFRVSNAVLHHLSPYAHIEVATLEPGQSPYFQRSISFYFERDRRWWVGWNPLQIHLLFLSLALLSALIGATPVRMEKRLRMLGLGLLLLFVTHVLTTIVLARCYVCLHHDPSSFSCTLLRRVLYMSGQIVPLFIWVPLVWGHLSSQAASSGESARHPPTQSHHQDNRQNGER